jgi:Tfp pilus assembly protein PilV
MSNKHSQFGFSLVETLVAITILLMVIVGPMAISTASSKSTSFGNEQAVAFMLAQEGAELMQRARDDLILQHTDFNGSNIDPWADFRRETGAASASVFRNCYQSTGCGTHILTDSHGTLYTVAQRLLSCASPDACKLYLESNPNRRARYTHVATAESTPYLRVIKMTKINADEVRVVSTVTWRSGFSREQQSVSVETSLFNVYGLP